MGFAEVHTNVFVWAGAARHDRRPTVDGGGTLPFRPRRDRHRWMTTRQAGRRWDNGGGAAGGPRRMGAAVTAGGLRAEVTRGGWAVNRGWGGCKGGRPRCEGISNRWGPPDAKVEGPSATE